MYPELIKQHLWVWVTGALLGPSLALTGEIKETVLCRQHPAESIIQGVITLSFFFEKNITLVFLKKMQLNKPFKPSRLWCS